MDVDEPNVTLLPALSDIPPPALPEDYRLHRGKGTPLVIDNGSSTVRFGFAGDKTPRVGPNTVSKYKERKTNRPMLVFGEAVDIESAAKTQIRTPWEGDVLLNFDALENVLDYTFVKLGLDDETVAHPVLMSERLSSPLHSRALTSELMFELYSVPSLAYCVDGVMSFYENTQHTRKKAFDADGIVVSFNTASTSVIPILDGKGIMSAAKRISFGAAQATEYLLKLAQMKYSSFPHRLVSVQANWMLRTFCAFSPDYPSLLRSMKDPLALRSAERVIQFPFSVITEADKTQEELDRITERRREQGRKLQEIAAAKRLEKFANQEAELIALSELLTRRATMSKRDWARALEADGFDDDAALQSTVKKLDAVVKKAKRKQAGDVEVEEPEEEPSWPLLDVPDAELDDEQKKEKKKQRLLKAGYDARIRNREQKAIDAAERAADVKKEEEERERDLTGWSNKLRREHDALTTKLKDRVRRRNDLGDRKSAATQARMKNIANLAADEKRPKGKRKVAGEDTFGADDADWAIYRKINTQAASSDEEDDLQNLQDVETRLLAFDPNFTIDHTYASITTQRSALLAAFKPEYDEIDSAGRARIHLTTERWKVCEAWFSPNIAGVDSAGIGEVLQSILSGFDDAQKRRLVQSVFITGGPSQLPGLSDRLHSTLRPILSPDTDLRITSAASPVLDSWKGMSRFASSGELPQVSITRAEYDEWGGERIKRWWGGNWNASVLP